MLWLLYLLAAHWVADFVLQTHWQASNKSHNLDALGFHVASYTAYMAFASLVMFLATGGEMRHWVMFVLANCVLHFWTDFFTSRVTSKLWKDEEWHNFFAVVGLDQLIHQATLAWTLWLWAPQLR